MRSRRDSFGARRDGTARGFVNYNEDVKKMWEAEQEKRIADGEKNWEEFKKKKPAHKG